MTPDSRNKFPGLNSVFDNPPAAKSKYPALKLKFKEFEKEVSEFGHRFKKFATGKRKFRNSPFFPQNQG